MRLCRTDPRNTPPTIRRPDDVPAHKSGLYLLTSLSEGSKEDLKQWVRIGVISLFVPLYSGCMTGLPRSQQARPSQRQGSYAVDIGLGRKCQGSHLDLRLGLNAQGICIIPHGAQGDTSGAANLLEEYALGVRLVLSEMTPFHITHGGL